MKKALPIVIILLLLAAAAGGGWWTFTTYPQVWAQVVATGNQALADLDLAPATPAPGLLASGTIEAKEVSVTAEVGGRIVELNADEGDEVTAGDVLVRLDTAMLDAQLGQARAAVQVAEAALARVKAGVKPGEIRKAEAAVTQAQVAGDGACQAWRDAIRIRDNPQELDAQIDAARAQVAVAEAQLQQAYANKDAAELSEAGAARAVHTILDLMDQNLVLETPFGSFGIGPETNDLNAVNRQWNEAGNQVWRSWIAIRVAEASLEGAKRDLANLIAMRDNPLEMSAQVNQTEAACDAAEAAVKLAEAQLAALKAGASQEQVAVAEARVRQAESALAALETQREKMTLSAPSSGMVVERTVHRGELAAPGATLLTIADLDEVTLTIYIPEDEIGKVKVGQTVQVTVDSFPNKTFIGRVTYIASEAEFTPKNVQTEKERVNMVFGVKVKIPNPDHDLKPGMPADAIILGI